MKEKLQFKVSAALKNIIGKELITDKYIAIFELVKNSFDAYAERVDVNFYEDKIVIKDDGKGMNIKDIKDKWLFVGYSAKADNTENRGYNDYRNKIKTRHAFAGAKGVGRFACDRIGKKLKLISIKEEENPKIEKITVEWELFEKDSKKDFINIDVTHETLDENPYSEIKHGTILEISELREEWTDGKKSEKEKLKTHLSKLINPIKKDSEDVFDVFLDNKKVENFIFEKLALKTTQINIDISQNGEYIITELIDRGEKIYKIKEKNEWKKFLFDIRIQLFYLNTPTKITFKHYMGVRSKEFGSIFLYKNGFRVFPYGELDDDSLGVNLRKQQGYARYLGTRDVVGFIDINNTSDEFKETTSRDGGLIATTSVKNLKSCFEEKVLRRLESYVIGTLNWTYKRNIEKEFFPKEKEKEIQVMIKKLTKSKDFLDIEHSYIFLEKIEEKTQQGFQGATGQLKKEARKTGDEKLLKAVKKIEETQEQQKHIIQKQESKIKRSEDQVSALRNFSSKNLKNLQSYHHQIGISSKTIDNYILHAFNAITGQKYEKLEKYLQKIKKENDKINTIARFATGSGMNELATKKERSLNNIIKKYLEDDYIPVAADGLEISIKDNTTKDFLTSFRPFDVLVIFDNLLDNAKKAKAKNCNIELYGDDKTLEIFVMDNGSGINEKFQNNTDEIFNLKTSSTDGAGIGLFHVEEILKSVFNANISVASNKKTKGITFTLTFAK
ncbi:MAG: sensor histidine kinase [Candidatus Aenigmarchaeota archaeon]|nr:sensor histidine kinase [Candidatus Aenigmarchaeota archaeon]